MDCMFCYSGDFFSGSYAHAFLEGKITKYTADQVMIDSKGNVEHGGKIYVTPEKIRMDGISPGGPRKYRYDFS